MLYRGNLQLRNAKKSDVQVDKFSGGENVLLSPTRLKKNEAANALNLMLIEDGVYDKRWGTKHYGGVTFTNRPDGASEYRASDGTRKLIVIADGHAYVVDPIAKTKTAISGGTYTVGYPATMVQTKSQLWIVNGHDPLSYYDGSVLNVFSGIDTPTWGATPLARGAGLSSGNIHLYYRVTAVNNVGETIPSAEETISVDVERSLWNSASNENVVLTWNAVTGATKYIIYYADASGYEVKLDETLETTYTDDGTATPNSYIEPPTSDGTVGAKMATLTLSGNRLWGCGDPENPWRVYFSGTGVNLGNFSSAYDGGWIDLERGGRATTTVPIEFQGVLKVFCKTDDGKGDIWEIAIESVTVGDTVIATPIPRKIISSIGMADPRAIVYVENDIFFWNDAKGIHVLGNEPGILSELRTNEVSANLRPFLRALPRTGDKCAYYYNSKVLFSSRSSESSSAPDMITVYDRERTCLIKKWTVGVSQFLEFTDENNVTHLLGIASDGLIEFAENYPGDDGVAFRWKYLSPRFPVSSNWGSFATIKRIPFRFRGVSGTIAFTVYGTKKSGNFLSVASSQLDAIAAGSGVGWDIMGACLMGDTEGSPATFTEDSTIRYLVINQLLRDVQLSISGSELQSRAVFLGYRIEGKASNSGSPLKWKL